MREEGEDMRAINEQVKRLQHSSAMKAAWRRIEVGEEDDESDQWII